jgi:hypothetical protein
MVELGDERSTRVHLEETRTKPRSSTARHHDVNAIAVPMHACDLCVSGTRGGNRRSNL